MTDERERHQRLRRLWSQALELPAELRGPWLDRHCADDVELRERLEGLLADSMPDTVELAAPVVATAEDATSASGERLGPYRLGRVLGTGGMGVVHLAVHEESRETVAVKLLHPEFVSSDERVARARREAQIGRRVEHPSVVHVYGLEESGGDDPRIGLVMEYVEGRTLREVTDELGSLPEGLLRHVAMEIAAGLAAIHAVGVVHRDLKPANVILSSDQRVRIMDLGVAHLQEATIALTREGLFIGSFLYAAPEQFRGEPLTEKTDLYALGVLLYELACGENPFTGDDLPAVMHRHLTTEPDPLAERGGVSEFLSEVVATLLAKDPEDRFASGRELHAVLRAGESGPWWQTRRQDPSVGPAPVRPQIQVRAESALYGREDELAELTAAWQLARGGMGRAVLVRGGAGSGKSRLLRQLVAAVEDDAHVLYGSFPPTGGLTGLTEALRGLAGGDALERRLRTLLYPARDLLKPLVALLRREVPSDRAGVDVLEASCLRIAAALAAEAPTLWIVEDLHFAPAEAVRVVQVLARSLADQPVLLVTTTRLEEGFHGAAATATGPAFSDLRLPRLSDAAVRAVLEDLVGSAALADVLHAPVLRQSEGVPLFVVECVRSLVDRGILVRRADGRLERHGDVELTIPAAARNLFVNRLEALSGDERDVLDVAAVQGHEFDAERVADVLELRLVKVLRILAGSEREHELVRSVGARYRFDHHLFQEVVYDAIPPRLRMEYHADLAASLARSLAERHERPGPDDARFLATHHLRGSRPHEGLPHLGRALQYLLGRNLFEEALSLAQAALDKPDLLDERRRIDVLLHANHAARMLTRREPQRTAAEEAVELADRIDDPSLQARALAALGRVHFELFDHAEAEGRLLRAEELARQVGDDELRLETQLDVGLLLARTGRTQEAVARLEATAKEARELDCESAHIRALTNLSAAVANADLDRAVDVARAAVSAAKAAGERRFAARALGRLGSVLRARFDREEAVDCLEEALAEGELLGDRQVRAQCAGPLGLVSMELGRLPDACAAFELQLEIGREIGHRGAIAEAMTNLANALIFSGDLQRGLVLARQATEESRSFADPRMLAHTLCVQSAAYRYLGRDERALATAQEALTIALDGQEPVGAIQAYIELASLAIDAERTDEALGLTERAIALADESGIDELYLFACLQRAPLVGELDERSYAILEQYGPRLAVNQRLSAHTQLWQTTGDRRYLDLSLADLAIFEGSLSPEGIERMRNAVPLVRNLVQDARHVGALTE